jgi:hypothetical protein
MSETYSLGLSLLDFVPNLAFLDVHLDHSVYTGMVGLAGGEQSVTRQ